jgi:hypothetical protein
MRHVSAPRGIPGRGKGDENLSSRSQRSTEFAQYFRGFEEVFETVLAHDNVRFQVVRNPGDELDFVFQTLIPNALPGDAKTVFADVHSDYLASACLSKRHGLVAESATKIDDHLIP